MLAGRRYCFCVTKKIVVGAFRVLLNIQDGDPRGCHIVFDGKKETVCS